MQVQKPLEEKNRFDCALSADPEELFVRPDEDVDVPDTERKVEASVFHRGEEEASTILRGKQKMFYI